MKYIHLKFLNGREGEFDIKDEGLFTAENRPGIVLYRGKAFYGVGMRKKGTIGVYQECDTFTIDSKINSSIPQD